MTPGSGAARGSNTALTSSARIAHAIAAAARVNRRGACVIMPWVRGWKMTERAAVDALDQAAVGPVSLVLHRNTRPPSGPVAGEEAEAAMAFARCRPEVIELQTRPAPLGALWNADLFLAAQFGHTDALVVNNDVRLHPLTYFYLRTVQHTTGALFVGASNCATEGVTWKELRERKGWWPSLRQVVEGALSGAGRGGPDFSCFLITKECWGRYEFDPHLTYFGDNDYHRQLVLGGDGQRIFGACVPYWHIGSQTIALADGDERARLRGEFEAHRKHYCAKWGGAPGGEQFTTPHVGGQGDSVGDGVGDGVESLEGEHDAGQ